MFSVRLADNTKELVRFVNMSPFSQRPLFHGWVANLEEDEIKILEMTLRRYLQYRLVQLNDDRFQQLRDDCLSMADGKTEETDEAQTILRMVWNVLK